MIFYIILFYFRVSTLSHEWRRSQQWGAPTTSPRRKPSLVHWGTAWHWPPAPSRTTGRAWGWRPRGQTAPPSAAPWPGAAFPNSSWWEATQMHFCLHVFLRFSISAVFRVLFFACFFCVNLRSSFCVTFFEVHVASPLFHRGFYEQGL